MKARDILLLVLFVPVAACVVCFGFDLFDFADARLGMLLNDAVPRLAAGGYLLLFLLLKGYGESYRPAWRPVHLLWSLPCFAVAIANFPFSALISGAAKVDRADLLWLFLLKCFGVALLEESFFRVLLVPVLAGEKKKYFRAVLLSSLLFGAMHLLNLVGGNVGAVLLQVGYTFLLGGMFSVMLLVTKNAWLCIGTHFLFDVGGTLVTDLGHGPFQDTLFWVLTAVCGVLCAVHVVLSLVRLLRTK